jgi:hypothetical protein
LGFGGEVGECCAGVDGGGEREEGGERDGRDGGGYSLSCMLVAGWSRQIVHVGLVLRIGMCCPSAGWGVDAGVAVFHLRLRCRD